MFHKPIFDMFPSFSLPHVLFDLCTLYSCQFNNNRSHTVVMCLCVCDNTCYESKNSISCFLSNIRSDGKIMLREREFITKMMFDTHTPKILKLNKSKKCKEVKERSNAPRERRGGYILCPFF